MLVVGPFDVQQTSELFADLGFRIVSGKQFLGRFISDDSRQLRLFPLRYRCGPAVFVSWLMWLFLSLQLLVLLWLDLYSCNGPTISE